MTGIHDLLIIGGGINGAGIARDAAGRGLKVMLVEKGDLAGATSSASSKLIHGGLRYLEHFAFRLVRESLAERDVLLRAAPHLIAPLRIVLPHVASLRPAWLVRAGLFLYDNLARRTLLPASRAVDLPHSAYGRGLKAEFHKGFVYSDGWVDDSRLVVLNVRAAAELGAAIHVRTAATAARRESGLWRVTLSDGREVASRAIVNAAGPWVHDVIAGVARLDSRHGLRLVKGSHIVVERLYDGHHAFLLQNDDRRVIFVLPYERRYTLIGTTDVPFDGDPAKVAASAEEIDYLCRAAGRYLDRPVSPADVVASFAGVRPLYDDGTPSAEEVTRDYVLDLDQSAGGAPLLSVFGGKLTTYRRLAEQALVHLAPFFPGMKPPWTASSPLPGGDIAWADFNGFLGDLTERYRWMPAIELAALARRHGTRAYRVLDDARSIADLGEAFGGGLYAREVRYLVAQEWAQTAADVLERRTKAGLHMNAAQRGAVEAYLSGMR